LAVALPEAGSEQPLGGGASHLPAANTLRCGALKLPRLRTRSAYAPVRHSAAGSSITWCWVAGATLLALPLVGGLFMGKIGNHRATNVERREPSVTANSIEAWLRHMTVTRALPQDATPPAVPESL
jgi:hypothetical protein